MRDVHQELPPDRPTEAPIGEVWEATQEFLTDWLVRGKVDEALDFLSDSTMACVDMDDTAGDEVLRAGEARRVLREGMQGMVEAMGDRDNLAEAVSAVLPKSPEARVIPHPFDQDFTVGEVTVELAGRYLCEPEALPPGTQPTDYGIYWGSLFRFKLEGDQGGVLGLLWKKENGNWRIVAYEVFRQ